MSILISLDNGLKTRDARLGKDSSILSSLLRSKRLFRNGCRGLSKRGQEVVHREFSYQKFAGIVHGEVERALGDRFGGTSSLADPCLS